MAGLKPGPTYGYGMAPDEFQQLGAAVAANDAAAVASLLQRNPPLKARLNEPLPTESFGTVALQVAVRRANRAMIDVLLDAGADINQRSHWWAGSFGVLDDADAADWLPDYLISRGATLDPTAAAKLNRLDDLRAMVAADRSAVQARGGDGQTSLHRAPTVEMAAFLLDHGADIDARDVDHESTPAQYLVRDRPDVARYLVSRGCSTDILLGAALGDTAVVARHLAANPAAVRTSVDATWFPMKNPHAGGSIYIWTLGARKTAHTIAREFGDADVERQLWEAGDDSLTLAMACELGDDDLVRSLISARPELVRALQPADVTRIVAAAQLRNGDAVKRMLAIGWPAGAVDRGGLTALHWAGFHGDAATARALLAAGAPLDVRDDVHSGTPLGWALWGSVHGWHRERGDYAGTVQAMLDAGATPPDITDTLVASDEVKSLLRSRK
jgi:ankyrin repeat protein